MQTFLAAIPLKGASVVVIGGGEPALAKLRLFLASPAALTWYAPGGAPKSESVPAGAPPPVERTPSAADLSGARLVFIAVEDEADAVALADMARSTGAQVNVVDRPALSDFQTPALIDRDSIVVGVATGGQAPILARDIRSRIEGVLSTGLGPLADIAGALRDRVKSTIPDFMARRRFWEAAFRGVAADLAAVGRTTEARAEIERLLEAAAPEAGFAHLIGVGPGDPELLTLRAVRLLQDADLLVHDATIPDAVIERARRDVHRVLIDPSCGPEAATAIMIEAVGGGERVVRLYLGDARSSAAAKAELRALEAAGLTVILEPGVT